MSSDPGIQLGPDEVEQFAAQTKTVLGQLEAALCGRLTPDTFFESVRIEPLAVGVGRCRSLADPTSDERDQAIERDWFLIRSALGAGDGASLSAYAKVIGVRSRASGGVTSRVRAELSCATGPGQVRSGQAVLLVEVDWIQADGGGYVPEGMRCIDVEVIVCDDVEPMFVEKTKGLLAGDVQAAATLATGSNEWAQRLDDPGLTAFFGHQGMAAGDISGDGLPDLYVAMPSGLPNMLLVQQPDGTAVDRARDYGVAWLDDTKGVLIQDLDGDGVNEIASALGHVIVVQATQPVREGAEPTVALSVVGWCAAPDEAPFYSICASDLDGDGVAEIFGTRYMATRYADTVPVPFDEARNGPGNVLFKFDGQRYRDVTKAIGLAEPDGGRFSLAASFVDYDLDGDSDLYVVNDFGSNRMWRLDGKRFTDVTEESGLADKGAGMGASWADADGDGDLDVYVTNMFSSAGQRVALQGSYGPTLDAERRDGARELTRGSSLLINDGNGRFERADEAGVSMGRWGWGGIFTDLNQDGLQDLVAPAGFLTGPKPGDL